jgi:hypothetical protein
VRIRKPDAGRCHSIEIRRLYSGCAIAAQVTPTEIIGIDDHDVRALLSGLRLQIAKRSAHAGGGSTQKFSPVHDSSVHHVGMAHVILQEE